MSLFGGNKLHVAVLIDFVQGQKKKVEELRRSTLLRDQHILTFDTYVGQTEADIEDVIGRPAYVQLVNTCYDLGDSHKVPTQKPDRAPTRVLKEVESHFRTLPPSVTDFDHFSASSYLFDNRADLFTSLPEIQAALDRFEKIFQDLNSFLPSS